MPPTALPVGQKRKRPEQNQQTNANDRKRQKFQEAHRIPTQTADKALSKNGELNIASFIKSREYEINALDKSVKKARQILSTRAFQQVPRHLRRRTASHNVKKVPRRLRGRAKREMMEDNTPTVNSKTKTPTSRLRLRQETAKSLQRLTQKRKTARQKKRENKKNTAESDPSKHTEIVRAPRIKKNKLADPPLATSKFKRRQVAKTWLPTHLWHTKRAHMTRPTQPLWRTAIPLRPTEKCYRATHRSSESRGCVAWDMSYISTVACLGTDTTLEALLKALGFHGSGWGGSKYQKWKTGSRFMSGWLGSRDGTEAVATVDVLWCAKQIEHPNHSNTSDRRNEDVEMTDGTPKMKRQKTKLDRKILIQIHPSAFQQFWLNLLHMAKLQKPQVLVEDLRFEIGCVDMMGPASTESLAATLNLAQANEQTRQIWDILPSLSNPAILPLNVILTFNIEDPRLKGASKFNARSDDNIGQDRLHEIILDWPLDANMEPSSLFSHKARYIASKLPSQWTLNRRRQSLLPGTSLNSTSKDPTIPVMLLAHRSRDSPSNQQGHWTLLAPWGCIDVIWRKLLQCSLSSGGRPRFGGLREKQQTAFERNTPWYPGDFPGTEAGKSWERLQAERRFDEWIKHPPSRRIAWERLDLGTSKRGELGRGWSCDWEYLFTDSMSSYGNFKSDLARQIGEKTEPKASNPPMLTQRQRKIAKARAEAKNDEITRRRNTSSPESDTPADRGNVEDEPYMQLPPATAKSLLQNTILSALPRRHALVTIRITYIGRGTPRNAARIYRLPAFQRLNSSSKITSMLNNNISKHTEPLIATPPAAQASVQSNQSKIYHDPKLRDRWLALDTNTSSKQSALANENDRLNHWGLPRKRQHYEVETLRHINVLPKNATQEIREQYGPQPLTEEEEGTILRRSAAIRIEEEKVWETHVPCPEADDLIGFVTSGGYNLAGGRGTAVGAVWIQRLLSGWAEQETIHQASVEPTKNSHQAKNNRMKQARTSNRIKDRERYLCIVRNAGESVGRLASWEVCE